MVKTPTGNRREPLGVRLDGIHFRVGSFAIENLSLEVAPGEYFVLTGPNGSGKTILLRLITGLLAPAAGDILIGEKSVTNVPPWTRGIGYVPQDDTLFPNRTVARNLAFGLEVRKTRSSDRMRRVKQIAEFLGVSHLLERAPAGLSGGERQRVSIARALIIEPSVLLLDEPVSSIDEEARDGLCRELKAIQHRTNTTTIHVSHNRAETELVADRVGHLVNGAIESSP